MRQIIGAFGILFIMMANIFICTGLIGASGFEVVPQRNSTGGEDFAFYLEKIPGCFINVGTGVGYPNHHPKFYADEAALTPAAEYLEKLLVEALRQ